MVLVLWVHQEHLPEYDRVCAIQSLKLAYKRPAPLTAPHCLRIGSQDEKPEPKCYELDLLCLHWAGVSEDETDPKALPAMPS